MQRLLESARRARPWLLSVMASLLLVQEALAGAGIDRLRAFLADTQTLQAKFEQTVLAANQEKIQQANGTFYIQRPGKFRWDYQSPDRQLIVADGDRVWIYDIELEQVTVKPQDRALADTPASLLSGTAPIDENFGLENLDSSGDGLDWVELRPKKQDGTVERVRLAFGSESLERMEMVDRFDQVTAFRFHRIRRNITLDRALFRFRPPPGVDVVGEQIPLKDQK